MDSKNNYPLSLLLDIVKNISTKKVFIKMDLEWDYNNIWIKEEKAVFMTTEGVFKTYGNVLCAYKFPSNILNDDKWDPLRLNQHWESSDLYWWCYSKNRNRGGTWWDNRGSSKEVSRE